MFRKLMFLPLIAFSACSMPMSTYAPVRVPTPTMPPATATPQSVTERFVTSAAANGCVVTADNSATIMADAVLSREDVGRAMTELQADGRGEIAPDGTGFRVTGGACAA